MGISLPGWQVRTWTKAPSASYPHYDVVVAGGGISGCSAAIAAARRGVRVLLLEPTHLLGGQMTVCGVGAVDLAPGFATTQEQGLWKEVARRIRTIYGGLGLTSAVTRYRLQDSMGVNTPITDRVFTELCQDAGVEIARNCQLLSATVTTTGASVDTSLGVLTAAVVVDATEDGSLLQLADLPYRIGNLTGHGDVVNGDPAASSIQRITQCAVIQRYDLGVPDGLKLLQPPPDYDTYRDGIAEYYPAGPGVRRSRTTTSRATALTRTSSPGPTTTRSTPRRSAAPRSTMPTTSSSKQTSSSIPRSGARRSPTGSTAPWRSSTTCSGSWACRGRSRPTRDSGKVRSCAPRASPHRCRNGSPTSRCCPTSASRDG